ncbi:MAG: hypothetical protein ACRETB_12740 [Steroidobacteraceae bacterium]
MNEIELLDAQLAAEREHVREVASWCAMLAARGRFDDIYCDFTDNCHRYLMFILRQEDARAAVHLELAAERTAEPRVRAASERLRKALGSSPGAVVATSSADAHADSRLDDLAKLAAHVVDLIDSRIAVATLIAPRLTLGERRRTAHVDADSILEERRLHAQVARHGTSVIR